MRSIIEREAFAKRLLSALARVGDDGSSSARLAREFNLRYSGKAITLHAARKWLLGEAFPAQDKLRVLAAWLGVPAEWLRFGDGPALSNEANEPTLALNYELMREIAALSPAHQEAVRALVHALRTGKAPR